MPDTARLLLPNIEASQAQKHVTHNEALRLLDGIVQASVLDATRTSPPAGAAAGDCHIVASGAIGDWTGWDGDVAMRADGAWYRIVVREGWRVWDQDAGDLLVRSGGGWLNLGAALGFLQQGAAVEVAVSEHGGFTGVGVLEETISGLTGATVDSTIQIPARSICLGVSTRTFAAITGATSYHCGLAGQPQKFGGFLGVGLGATNLGVIGPEAFYSDTPIQLTANGSDFTGGAVRLAIHYLTIGVPS